MLAMAVGRGHPADSLASDAHTGATDSILLATNVRRPVDAAELLIAQATHQHRRITLLHVASGLGGHTSHEPGGCGHFRVEFESQAHRLTCFATRHLYVGSRLQC